MLDLKQRESLVKVFIFYLFFVVVTTELLSYFNVLNRLYLTTIYIFCSIVFAYGLKEFRIKVCWHDIRNNWPVLVGILAVLLPLLFIALYYPPNNYDSMTYHLPRIEHWIQNKNVKFFETNNSRQNFMTPLSEYVILHWRVLLGSDVLSNLVQYISMILSIIVSVEITGIIRNNYFAKVLSVFLLLTIPMGIMQSTTTQTDYLTAFLLISFVYYGLTKNGNMVALLVALGMFSKLSFLVFALPFGIWFLFSWIKTLRISEIVFILFKTMFLIVAINGLFWSRNYSMYGNIQGPTNKIKQMSNQIYGWGYFTSNVVKNIGSNLSLPFKDYNTVIDLIIEKIHYLLQVRIDDINNSFAEYPYRTSFGLTEDVASNFVHTIIFIFSIVVFCIQSGRMEGNIKKKNLWYLISVIAGFGLYSALFKWQPWGTRLLLPLYVVMVPVVAVVLSYVIKRRVSQIVFVSLLYIVSVPFIVGNMLFDFGNGVVRSMSARSIGIRMFDYYKTRTERYFILSKSLYQSHLAVAKFIKDNGIRNIGLDLGGDSWEYPIWQLTNKIDERRIGYIGTDILASREKNKWQIVIYDNDDTERKVSKEMIDKKMDYGEIRVLMLKSI
jgi:hypothetical protein